MRIFWFIWLMVTVLCVSADVLFTAPSLGAVFAGGTEFTVSWEDSVALPNFSDLADYQLYLFAGSYSNPQQILTLTKDSITSGSSLFMTIPITSGGATPNAYFFGIIATVKTGGTITNYSPHFSLTGMTGTFSAAVSEDIDSVAGTAGLEPASKVGIASSSTSSTRSSTTLSSLLTLTSSILPSSAERSSTSATSKPISTSSATSTARQSSFLSNEVKAGLGIGAGIFLLLILPLLGYASFQVGKRFASRHNTDEGKVLEKAELGTEVSLPWAGNNEQESKRKVAELYGNEISPVAELSAGMDNLREPH